MRLQTLAFVLLAATACSSDPAAPAPAGTGGGPATKPPGSTGADASVGGGVDASTPPPPLDTDSGVSVDDALATRAVGFYAVKSVVASIQDIAVLGKQPSVATSLGVGEVKRKGAALVLVERGCHVELSATSIVIPSVPDALPNSVPPVEYPFRVWQEGAVVKFVRDAVATPIGVKLTAPETDALPTVATDPRVWDQDGDGKPGVTVKMGGSLITGDIFVIQKQRAVYSGELSAAGAFVGLVRDSSQQATIGATNDALKQNVPTTPDPDASKSNVRFAKLSASYDCARLLAEAKALFP